MRPVKVVVVLGEMERRRKEDRGMKMIFGFVCCCLSLHLTLATSARSCIVRKLSSLKSEASVGLDHSPKHPSRHSDSTEPLLTSS